MFLGGFCYSLIFLRLSFSYNSDRRANETPAAQRRKQNLHEIGGNFCVHVYVCVPWDPTLGGRKPYNTYKLFSLSPHCNDRDVTEPTTNPPREASHSECSCAGNKMFQQGENPHLLRMAATSVHKVKNRTGHFSWNSWKDLMECALKVSSIL